MGFFEMFLYYFLDNFFVSSFRNSCQLVSRLPGSMLYSFVLSVFLSFCFIFLARRFSRLSLNPPIEFFMLAAVMFFSPRSFLRSLILFSHYAVLLFCDNGHAALMSSSVVLKFSFIPSVYFLCFLHIPYCCLFGLSLIAMVFLERQGCLFLFRRKALKS